jgi:NADP-dependent 3-hydroxy acid dehydrogenase YdfG
MAKRWEGRVAVVTGASAGIGYSVAQLLVKRGMKVVACARNIEKIQVGHDNSVIIWK